MQLIFPMSSEYSEYLRDESRSVGSAETISFPRNKAQLEQVLKELRKDTRPITVQGARTGLAAAAAPNGGHIINLSRMNAALGMRYDEGRFFVRLEPGLALTELRKLIDSRLFPAAGWDEASQRAYAEFLKAPPQFFPPDPTEASASLGGMVACNASGARTYMYGATRRHISALRLLLPDGQTLILRRGEVFAAGRHLTLTTDEGNTVELELPSYPMPDSKNASGYFVADDMDAIDLFIGSDGTLGIIFEIEVALSKEPDVIWGATCFFENDDTALRFVERVRTELDKIASIEYFDKNALNILRRQRENSAAFAELPEVDARFTTAIYLELHCGSESEACERLTAAGSVMEDIGAHEADSWVARTIFDKDKLIFFRHATPESVNMIIDARKKEWPGITKLGSDMSVPDAHLFDVCAFYRQSLKENDFEYAIWGHIGNNHLHVNILPRNEEEYLRGKAVYNEWARVISAMGGAVSAEHGVGKLKSAQLQIMYGEAAILEMARLKAVFDPLGRLGSGNLFEPLGRAAR